MYLAELENELLGSRILRITGWLLILAGFANGLISVLYELSRFVFWQSWFLIAAVVLFFVFRTDPLRILGRLTGSSILAIWAFFELQRWGPSLSDVAFAHPEEHCLGLMLTTLGLLLVVTNDPHRKLHRIFRRARVFAKRRQTTALLLTVAALWFANPDHSHAACLTASSVCEKCGALDSAIFFANRAADTFRPISFCGTCYGSLLGDVYQRIDELEAKKTGVTTTVRIDPLRVHDGPAFIPAQSRDL
ncbi:hypothetical protein CA54_13300 [Symmachiella macrocystis]|uniref:Uncharacterized protein n=2 Tax=Symmachiella macrocystis TaxID=2527985 RepID=A0A5C6BMJ1_9PLAN|nr:hypothetical protein CA54_13300 [Symmachiella macrocystis]